MKQGEELAQLDEEVVNKYVDLMEAHELDGLVCLSPESFTHATGIVVPSQKVLRWRHSAVVINGRRDAGVLCVDMEESLVRSALPGEKLYVWEEFEKNAMHVLSAVIADLGLDSGDVGIELGYLPVANFEDLEDRLPNVRWSAVDEGLARSRQQKSPRELRILQELARLTDEAIEEAFRAVGPGSTELDLAGALLSALYQGGAEGHEILIVASGPRSQYPNAGPTERRLREGDIVRVEIFGVRSGYHAGVCRTGIVEGGRIGGEVWKIWSTLVSCRDAVLAALEPGRPARDVYETYIEHFSPLGYEPISFVGHGIGLQVHEEPYLGRFSDDLIKVGMTLGIEPLVFVPGKFGLQIKDIVSVEEDGVRLLSNVLDVESPAMLG